MKKGGLRLNNCLKSNQNNDLISIITVVYNGGEYIEQTIQSVINQSYDNFEYIIIDGGSTDNTIDIIKKYDSKIDFWISEKDNGITDAFNKGIGFANGELIGLVNADDYLDINILQTIFNEHDKNNPKVLCGAMRIINDKRPIRKWFSNPDGLEKEMTIAHPACFIPKSIYNNFGVYDPTYKIAMDYALFLKYKSKGVKFKTINSLITTMRSGGTSSQNYWGALLEIDKAKKMYLKNYSLLKSYRYTLLRFSQVKVLNILDTVGIGRLISTILKRNSFK